MQLDIKEVIRQVRKIEIINRILVSNVLRGAYLSTFKGQGMEFADVREYAEGDDVRHIDWNVTARTTVPHVKQFQEEREMTVMLLVDASASSDFGTVGRVKRQLAVEFCASMAFSAIKNNDRVGLVVFTDRIEHYLPPKKGRAHIMRLIRDLISFEPRSRGTDLNSALEFLTHLVKKKCTAFLISDFQSPVLFEENLRRARFRHDLSAGVLTDPREREMPDVGIVDLEDPETGQHVVLDTTSARARRQFQTLAKEQAEQLRALFRRCRVDAVNLDTSRSYVDAIVAFFRKRSRRRR